MKNIIGFIGCGSMGGALARAAAKSVRPETIYLANRSVSKAAELAKELGGVASSNWEIAAKADYIFLGVKPQMMREMLTDIAPILATRTDRFILVSMAAGVTMADIQTMAGGQYPVIRIMPNTPVAVGAGVILYDQTHNVEKKEVEQLRQIMAQAGLLDPLPENLLDAGAAVAGCGPAFADLFLEALADGGVACGLPRAKAQMYAAQMLLGAAKLALDTGKHPGELKDAVCSPGGSTIAGVRALEQHGFRAACMEAVEAACERTKELGK